MDFMSKGTSPWRMSLRAFGFNAIYGAIFDCFSLKGIVVPLKGR